MSVKENVVPFGDLEFRAGALCLDFVNTVEWRTGAGREERLPGYPELVAWAARGGLLDPDEANHLLQRALRHPEEAAAGHARAIALREALYRLFSAHAHAQPPVAADLTALSAELAIALPRQRLVRIEAGYVWSWEADANALDRMLWPVARSAADLLASDQLGRVRECAGEGCGWLFLDASRNRSRRWCSMEDCGNRAKAWRFYRRQRGQTTESA